MSLEQLYIRKFGMAPDGIVRLTPAGSNRQYFRLNGSKTVIGVIGTSVDENEAFIYLGSHFKKLGLPVPEILAVSSDWLSYLQEDLGDVSLFSVKENVGLLKSAMERLPDFQFAGSRDLDFSRCFPVAYFDRQSVLWDLYYFKYCFLNPSHVSYREDLLEREFQLMAERLSRNPHGTFMYRDFQSRNVMIKDDKPFFIDFQGGRRGPFEYDVVSFLWQAKAAFPKVLKDELIDVYLNAVAKYVEVDTERFKSALKEFVLLRTLQVLGAYGFRGKFERKSHFLQSIPYALANLEDLLDTPCENYPYLNRILRELIAHEKEMSVSVKKVSDIVSSLTVTVTSFSYKKGIPEDTSGNGGGFVFDCRAMENPGRYAEYKTLTGLDKPVIDFLESRGEIQQFLEHCYALVDPSVQCYDSRGFTSLMVNFGCTGGQHRSVYSAQHLAEHIKKRFPNVTVHLIHREQNIDVIL
jgi:aminoglycoside/choline kinase family phosphotransferase